MTNARLQIFCFCWERVNKCSKIFILSLSLKMVHVNCMFVNNISCILYILKIVQIKNFSLFIYKDKNQLISQIWKTPAAVNLKMQSKTYHDLSTENTKYDEKLRNNTHISVIEQNSNSIISFFFHSQDFLSETYYTHLLKTVS